MNQSNDIRPPAWPTKILRFFVKGKYVEEIEGDMEEIFNDNLEFLSPRKARRLYVWEMIKLFRPVLIRNIESFKYLNRFSMFKNYFKVSIRGLMKRPLNSFINLFGLAAAISICVFGYAFTRWTFDRDQFHVNKDQVFLTTFFASREGGLREYGKTPRPLAELLKLDFPKVNEVCRVEDRNIIVKYQDQVFYERIRMVDPAFLQMFTFPLKWGTPASLNDVNSIIISETMSEKYFGEFNPIGQTLFIRFDKDRSKEFKVTGVAQKFPDARSLDFSFLANFENLRTSEAAYDFDDWATLLNATFIQVSNPTDVQDIRMGMDKYKNLHNQVVTEDFAIASYNFQPLSTIHLKTDKIADDIFRGGSDSNVTSIVFISVICVLLLAIACFNYINIAIVSATKRLIELGVRKSIGASRRVIVIQFLSENIVLTAFALIFGVLLGWLVVIPWFERLWHFNMGFRFNDVNLWMYLPIILLITAIASGIYPSLYISKFQAVSVLRGSLKFGQKNSITKILLAFQLILACVFITTAVMFTQNTTYLSKRSWGYNNREVLYAVLPDQLSLEQLSNKMRQDPNVVSISASAEHIGKQQQQVTIHLPSRTFESAMLAVDPNYFNTMGVELTAGRGFKDFEGSDRQAVVVNETMVKNLTWADPIGQQFKVDSIQYEVIGVTKDFHSSSFAVPLKPTFFKTGLKEQYRYLSLKVNDGTQQEAHESLQKAWAQLFPETPFNGGYQEDVWGGYYTQIAIYDHVWRVFASIAIVLAALGLYGLVSLNVSRRQKEFSIRMILGANVMGIANNILRQYYVLFAIALFVGLPASYFFGSFVIRFAYAYHMPITFLSALLSGIVLTAVLMGAVSTQIFNVFRSNPVDGIKAE